MAVQKSQLAVQLADVRGKRVGRLEPDALIKDAIIKWGEGDLFFRGEVRGLARMLNEGDPHLRICLFRQPGTDHIFAIPENRSVLLNRLGIHGEENGGYNAHIKATLIQALDEEGFEYLGSEAPELDRRNFGNVRVVTKSFTIDQQRLGKVLKVRNYIGFKTDKGLWCLVPQTNLVREEVMFEGVIWNV